MRSPLCRAAVAVLCLTLTAGAGAFAADPKPDADKVPRPELQKPPRPRIPADYVETTLYVGWGGGNYQQAEEVPIHRPFRVDASFDVDDPRIDHKRMGVILKVSLANERGTFTNYQNAVGQATRNREGRFEVTLEAASLKQAGTYDLLIFAGADGYTINILRDEITFVHPAVGN